MTLRNGSRQGISSGIACSGGRERGWRARCGVLMLGLALFLAVPMFAADEEGTAGGAGSSEAGCDKNEVCQYFHLVYGLLEQEKFAELDAVVATDRKQKGRFQGGDWKLQQAYVSLSSPWDPDSHEVKDDDWPAHLARLQRWVTARPDSITARVALAEAYVNYAWYARGEDYADLVKDQSWELFQQRLQTARDILEQASALKDTCPHWYVVMEDVALGQSWSLQDRNALLEQAFKIEPLYYYVYQQHAYALQPRWLGEEGDEEKFADEIATRIGGKQGDIIYFEIATINCGGCRESQSFFKRASWERTKRGYAANEELYGFSNYKLNEFASLAMLAQDQSAALPAFLRIGDHWEKSIWRSRSNFEQNRTWALAPPVEFLNAWKSAVEHYRDPAGAGYAKQFQADFHSSFDGALKKCTDATKYDEGAFTLNFRLDGEGGIEQVVPWPPTSVTKCLLPQVSGHRFAPPPQGSYWVSFNIGEVKPRPYVFTGVAFPDIGR